MNDKHRRIARGLCHALALLVALSPIIQQVFRPMGVFAEPDPTAYLMTAKQFAQQQTFAFETADIYRFHDHMWVESNGKIYSKYPPGFPLLLAAGWNLGGDTGMDWVSPFMGFVGLLAAYALLCRLAPCGWALGGMAYLAVSPIGTVFFHYPLTHAASFGCITLGMLMLWRWWERGGILNALLTGVLLGFAPLIRYTEVIAAVPVAVVVLLKLLRVRPACADPAELWPVDRAYYWRVAGGALVILAGALLCIVPLMLHHLHAFGSVFRTGYDLSGEQSAFTLQLLRKNVPTLIHRLNDDALFFVFPMGMLGWMVMLGRRSWDGLVLAMWAVMFFVVYAPFYWAPPLGLALARFQMPAIAAYAAGAVYLLHTLSLGGHWRKVVMPALLCVGIGINYLDSSQQMKAGDARPMQRALARVAGVLPADAVVFADGAGEDMLHWQRGYEVYRARIFHPSYCQPDGSYEARGLDPRIPWAPRRQEARRQRLYEYFNRDLITLNGFMQELIQRKLAAGRQVYFVMDERLATRILLRLGDRLTSEKVPLPPLSKEEAKGVTPLDVFRILPVPVRAAGQETETVPLEVGNPEDRSRRDVPVVIRVADLKLRAKLPQTAGFQVIGLQEGHNEENPPYQVDDLDGDGWADELVFMVNLQAGETRHYAVRYDPAARAWPQMQRNTDALDLPGWESEKFGYRAGGPFTLELFGKYADGAGLYLREFFNDKNQQIYNYHQASSYGMAILDLQKTAGLAGMVMESTNGIVQPEEGVLSAKVLASGPIRSMVSMTKETGNAAGRFVLTRSAVIYAHHFETWIEDSIQAVKKNEPGLVGVGMLKAPQAEYKVEPEKGLYLQWHKQNEDIGWVGLGLIFSRPENIVTAENAANRLFFIKTPLSAGQTLTNRFCAVGAWRKGGYITSFSAFQKLADRIRLDQEPLKVVIGRKP